jgi:signal transduction histidine kinase
MNAPIPHTAPAAPTRNFTAVLSDHLDAELKAYRALVALAEAKQKEIIAGNMKEFSALLLKEQAALAQSTNLKQQRERLFANLAERLNVPMVNLKLSALLERIAEPMRSQLATRQNDLRNLLERLRAANERNLLLIRHCLGYVRDVLGSVLGTDETITAGGYDRRGGSGDPAAVGNLVNHSG